MKMPNAYYLKSLPHLDFKDFFMRPVKFKDYIDLYDYGKDAEVVKYLSWDAYLTLEEAKNAITPVFLERPQNGQPAAYALVHKADHKMIGTCDLMHVDFAKKTAEIGFCLHKSYWNKGYMTQALDALIHVGFCYFNFKTIFIRHLKDNIASKRVIEKNNFTFLEESYDEQYKDILLSYRLDQDTFFKTHPKKKDGCHGKNRL